MSGAFLGATRFPLLIVLAVLFATAGRRLPPGLRPMALGATQVAALWLIGISPQLIGLYSALAILVALFLRFTPYMGEWSVWIGRVLVVLGLLTVLAALKYEAVPYWLGLEQELLNAS